MAIPFSIKVTAGIALGAVLCVAFADAGVRHVVRDMNQTITVYKAAQPKPSSQATGIAFK